jgi:hypothetical protein
LREDWKQSAQNVLMETAAEGMLVDCSSLLFSYAGTCAVRMHCPKGGSFKGMLVDCSSLLFSYAGGLERPSRLLLFTQPNPLDE